MYHRCIFFLIDGARYDVTKELLADGKLPNIEKYFLKNGSFLKGFSVLPTTTGPAHIPFLFGVFPGVANIPGIRWFDKSIKSFWNKHRSYVGPGSYFMGNDVKREYRSLFEYFSSPSNIFGSLDRCYGTRLRNTRIEKLLWFLFAHYSNRWELVDDYAGKRLILSLKGGCDFIFAVFPAIDELSHLTHPYHHKVLNSYLKIDRIVKDTCRCLEGQNILESTLLVMASDHGLTKTETHISLVDLLKEHGFNPLYYPKIFKRGYDSVVMESGNAMSLIYFLDQPSQPKTIDEIMRDKRKRRLIDTLLNKEGIEFIVFRLKNRGVCVLNLTGRLSIYNRNNGYYFKIKGINPLGFPNPGFIPEEDSILLTQDSPFPDSIKQLDQIFLSGRSGDIIVLSKKGYDLREKHEWPEHKSSHGSLIREHMEVPIFINYPIHTNPIRTVDLFSTILKLLGKTLPQNI
ncbi:MAG: alkaline phosphatase family protein, partial [bacterium]